MSFKNKYDPNINFLKKRLETPTKIGSSVFEKLTFSNGLGEYQISEREKISKETLKKFVKQNLGNDKGLLSLVDQIVKEGGEALRALANNDVDFLNKNIRRVDHLEIIVQTDGTRPSFLIKNGLIDFTSSPVTDWGEMLTARSDFLQYAINCVGRINAY